MESQFLLNLAFGISGTLAAWFIHLTWDSQKSIKNDLKKIESDIPSFYVRRDDFKDFSKDIKEMFSKIMDKLDQKQDKK